MTNNNNPEKMNNVTPEQFIEALNQWKMTPEGQNGDTKKLFELTAKQRKIADVKNLGIIIAEIILLFLTPTLIWLVLFYLVGFQIAWAKVFGIYFIFNLLKNTIVSSLKK